MINGAPSQTPTPALPVEASPLTLTPREWRRILEDPAFLARPDNRYQQPRRLNGRPVEIVRV